MRTGPALLAVAVLLALAGCVPSAPHSSAAPSASATPVFASDAEALAAAEKAYAAYLKVSDEIGADSGKSPERIAPYVTKGRLETELQGSKLFQSQQIRTVGATTYKNPTLEQVIAAETGTEVILYVCWDATGVRVLNSVGDDVTPADRVSRQTLQLDLETVGGKLPLRLKSDDTWSGRSSC